MFSFNQRQRRVLRLIVVNLLLLLFALIWRLEPEEQSVTVAVAKGKQMLDMNSMAAPALDVGRARLIALDERAAELGVDHEELAFVSAIPLSPGEARHWQDVGCAADSCAHVTLYDYANSTTVENVVNLDSGEVAASWQNAYARPGGSVHVLPEAMAIAAADPAVQSILGDIGVADPAMVPMSGWLADNACRDDWCVDLTFHDPNGTGRIFHVFVNLERQEVARTFYTRARPERAAAAPVAQRDAYTDGCHEQYGWNVCWEMTAHDGVNFRDATYGGELIFSSAKIGQIEAWYPSWPGGYRDEIGFSASVPPFGDTIINDLDDAFEVRQLFTEFTRWPNCICCYRYEEIIRFQADGGLDFEFISHGPGCDDLSVYRPFWRIDLDLAGPQNDQVWLYEDGSWIEQVVEFETHPVVEDLSPEGYKLATADDEMLYRWQMERTDPLELDEAYLFGLQWNEQEGEGPIITGPGDTYVPPRQWINDEPLSGENIVLWHVPLLKTKKGGPWWCMPDPEPEFSPCTAVLRAVPGSALTEATPTPTPSPTAPPAPSDESPPAGAVGTATPTPSPAPTTTPVPTPAPTATLRPIEGEQADEIVLNAGCGACHQIGSLGEGHKVGPDLSNIGTIAALRAPEMSAAEYIRQSILDPNALIAPQCPNGPCMPNIMPANYDIRLSPEQIDTLVGFLLEQKGAPSRPLPVEGSDSYAAPKAFPAPKTGIGGSTRDISPTTVVQILVLSLVFLLSLLVFLKGSPSDRESSR